MGRTLKVSVISARDLRNADAEEGGESDPFVVVCFDNKVQQELARTETAENTSNPEWNQDFEIDITKHIENTIAETEEEPKMITFCVYDGDEGQSEPLGVAGVSFSNLVKQGKLKSTELPVFLGSGFITVELALKKVKMNSMLKENKVAAIAGGVAGTAALGALGAYLYKRYQTKKEKEPEAKGIAYGADIDDDDDDDEDKGSMKRWWEMDDEETDDDDENRWKDVDEN